MLLSVALNGIIKWISHAGIHIAVKSSNIILLLFSFPKYKFCLHIIKCIVDFQPSKIDNSRGK